MVEGFLDFWLHGFEVLGLRVSGFKVWVLARPIRSRSDEGLSKRGWFLGRTDISDFKKIAGLPTRNHRDNFRSIET